MLFFQLSRKTLQALGKTSLHEWRTKFFWQDEAQSGTGRTSLEKLNNTENDSFESYKANGEKGNPRGKKVSTKDT